MKKVNEQNQFQLEDIAGEVWKDIPDFEESYAVSNYGRIKSKKRLITTSNNKSYIIEDRILSPNLAAKGYLYITLNKNCVKTTFLLHRLVAELFVPNPENLPFVDHIDTDQSNAEASNLKWCSASQNMNNPNTRSKLKESYIRNGRKVVQLKDGKIIRIYNYYSEAKPFGFISGNIKKVCIGLYKQYKGYQWMFLDEYESKFGPVQPNYYAQILPEE